MMSRRANEPKPLFLFTNFMETKDCIVDQIVGMVYCLFLGIVRRGCLVLVVFVFNQYLRLLSSFQLFNYYQMILICFRSN